MGAKEQFHIDMSGSIAAVRTAFPPWLRAIAEPLAPLFKEVLAVSLFVNVLAIAVPVFVLQVYDRVIYHAGMSTLEGLVIGILVVVAFDFVLRRARAAILQNVALQIDVTLSRRLVDKILALPLRTLESRTGAQWQLLFRDADIVRNTLSGASAVLVTDAVFALIFLMIVAVIAWPVFWVLVIMFGVFAAVAWRATKAIEDTAAKERGKIVNRDALVSDLILGRTTIKALAQGDAFRAKWEERQDASIRQSIARGKATDVYTYLGQTLTLLTTIAMTTVGALAILDQRLTMGGLIAANMLSSRLLSPMNQLIAAWRGASAFRQSVERLGTVFEEAEDLFESAVELPRPQGRVVLDDVRFTYGADLAPAVEGVSLDIAGGMTAVVGPNGCGKSTLAKLMLGLYRPDHGRVFLDGADIAQFARRDFARWVGYVPQECVLFSGTIRSNIACGRDDVTDEEIVRAANLARAHNLIVTLPQGYGTAVGEGGSQLAGGLRQRIAIARALVADPPVLVMDEPTASLDRAAEEELRTSLAGLARDHTIIVITHSPTLLQACHNVVLMDRGRVKAAGPTQKIMQAMQRAPEAQVVRVVSSGDAVGEPKPA